jgi:hypothetical protein
VIQITGLFLQCRGKPHQRNLFPHGSDSRLQVHMKITDFDRFGRFLLARLHAAQMGPKFGVDVLEDALCEKDQADGQPNAKYGSLAKMLADIGSAADAQPA